VTRQDHFADGAGSDAGRQSFFHGTTAHVEPGEDLLPGGKVGRGRGRSVWLTPSADHARQWAQTRVIKEGHGVTGEDGYSFHADPKIPIHVYEVEPHGLKQDRNGHWRADRATVKRRL